MKSSLILLFFSFMLSSVSAQKVWSLEECFAHALQNNISVKQMKLSEELAQNDFKQSKLNIYLPNINANVSESFNFGNSVDPTTYQFVNSATNSTRFSLSLNYNLFEGLSRINNVKSSKNKLSATELEVEELQNNTKIAITNLYLQIIISKEVLDIAKENKSLTQNQYNNSSALVDAGILAKGALLDIDAQLAQNDLNIINASSTLERSLNQLKLLLQLDPYEEFGIAQIKVSDELQDLNIDPKSIASNAFDVLPEMQSAEFRLKAAQYDLKATKGSLFPTFSISGFVGTNYFSAAQEVVGSTSTSNPIDVVIGGTPVTVDFPSQTPIFEKTKFGKQLENNLSENISLNLSIPILGSWQRRTAISNAKLNVIKSELDIDAKKQQLNQDVFNAYTDLNIAYKRYQATDKNIKASNEAFKYAQEKFKAGLLNALEFETAKNRKLSAQADRVQAKYEYFFRKVILNYYETGELVL